MAVAIGDIMQLKVRTVTPTQKDTLNVFYYKAETEVTQEDQGAIDLIDGFIADVLPLWELSISQESTITLLECENLFDVAEFGEVVADVVGVGTAELMPSFNAVAIRSNRERRDIRRGQKRIGPLTEGQVTDGILNAATRVILQNLADAFVDDIVTPIFTATFVPVVVKRIQYVPPGGGSAYRLPANQGEAESFQPTAWTVQDVTSQTSRK